MNVLVLGGLGGIGREVVKSFCHQRWGKEGNTIYYTHTTTDYLKPNELNKYIMESGNTPVSIIFDINSATFGYEYLKTNLPINRNIDCMINCIGVLRDRTLAKMTDEELDDVLDLNLRATIKLCQHIVPRIKYGGSITNISSIIGEIGGFGQCNYAASKAGIEGFTKSFAMETARDNIRVNCIVPSIVDTGIFTKLTPEQRKSLCDRTLLKRMATPREIADLIYFVAVTGTYFDGDIIPITCGFK